MRHVGLIEMQPTLLGQITGRQRFSAFHVSCCASLKRRTSAVKEVGARSDGEKTVSSGSSVLNPVKL